MDKKILIGVIIAIVVVVLGVGAYFAFAPKGAKTLDLATISENITNARFSEMATGDIDKDILQSVFQVNTENVEEVYGKMAMMNVHASRYLLIKAVDGKAEEVKQELEAYGVSYEEQWAMYLPSQHELVQNRKIGTIGNYVYLVIAEDAEELVNLIK